MSDASNGLYDPLEAYRNKLRTNIHALTVDDMPAFCPHLSYETVQELMRTRSLLLIALPPVRVATQYWILEYKPSRQVPISLYLSDRYVQPRDRHLLPALHIEEARAYAAAHWPERLIQIGQAHPLTVCLPRPERDAPTRDMAHPLMSVLSTGPSSLQVSVALTAPIETVLGQPRPGGRQGQPSGDREAIMRLDGIIREATLSHDPFDIHEMQDGHGAGKSSMINCFYCGFPLLTLHRICVRCRRRVDDEELHNRYPFLLPPKIVHYLRREFEHQFQRP